MAKELKPYRLLYVDKFYQKSPIDLIVLAYTKPEAEAKGYEALFNMACEDLRTITCGARPVSTDVLLVAPEYYRQLVHGCWVLTECECQISVSKHTSKRSADDVANAAEKTRRANRKKRRWSASEKAARKEAKLKKDAPVLVLPAKVA